MNIPLEPSNRITLFHSHGIGRFDYSSIRPTDLEEIDALAGERGLLICPTVFLRRERVHSFVEVVKSYHMLATEGRLRNIIGFSLEGPLLGNQGGIPRTACWTPTVEDWRTLIGLSSSGLRYVVVAPDALALDDEIGDGYTFRDLLRESYDGGLRIALGHFVGRDNPAQSAARVNEVLTYLHGRYESSPYLVLTDHLFNDMPRSFIHAWRTQAERTIRDRQLSTFLAVPWKPSTLADQLGPVPAALLKAARDRYLTPALNFDGYHVDLQICQTVVAYLGCDRIIAMTDETEVNILAGESLHQDPDSPLWHRDDGAVAAGSSTHHEQIANMISIGMGPECIDYVLRSTPEAALLYRPQIRLHLGEQLNA